LALAGFGLERRAVWLRFDSGDQGASADLEVRRPYWLEVRVGGWVCLFVGVGFGESGCQVDGVVGLGFHEAGLASFGELALVQTGFGLEGRVVWLRFDHGDQGSPADLGVRRPDWLEKWIVGWVCWLVGGGFAECGRGADVVSGAGSVGSGLASFGESGFALAGFAGGRRYDWLCLEQSDQRMSADLGGGRLKGLGL
jgi:hypothetical protein